MLLSRFSHKTASERFRAHTLRDHALRKQPNRGLSWLFSGLPLPSAPIAPSTALGNPGFAFRVILPAFLGALLGEKRFLNAKSEEKNWEIISWQFTLGTRRWSTGYNVFRYRGAKFWKLVYTAVLHLCLLWPWLRALAEKQVFVSRPWKLVQTSGLLYSFKMVYRTRFILNFWQSYGHLKMWIFPYKFNFQI